MPNPEPPALVEHRVVFHYRPTTKYTIANIQVVCHCSWNFVTIYQVAAALTEIEHHFEAVATGKDANIYGG